MTHKPENTVASNTSKVDSAEDVEAVAVLGVAAGEERYLISMSDVSEVITIPKLAKVPLTEPWFLGLANVRGNLYGINDLGVFLGGSPTAFNLKSRILLVASGSKALGGFIVNSMLGIRDLSEFSLVKHNKKKLPKGVVAQYKDLEGRVWRKLNLLELVHDEKFQHIERQ